MIRCRPTACIRYIDFFKLQAVWMRFFPAVVELQKQIAEGVIGEVKYIYANFGFKGGDLRPRLTDPKLGGGAVLDIGIYPINFATMIFGEKPESVHADGWLASTGVDEFAVITLKYASIIVTCTDVLHVNFIWSIRLKLYFCLTLMMIMCTVAQVFW